MVRYQQHVGLDINALLDQLLLLRFFNIACEQHRMLAIGHTQRATQRIGLERALVIG